MCDCWLLVYFFTKLTLKQCKKQTNNKVVSLMGSKISVFFSITAKCKINFLKKAVDVTTNLSTKNYIPVY